MSNLNVKEQRGSIALFVLISTLFFLVIVTTVAVSNRNKVAKVDSEYQKIKSSYEKDVGSEENVYYNEEEINGKLELQKVGDKKVKLVLSSTRPWDYEYNYKIYVKDGENQQLRVVNSGTTMDNTVESDEIKTFFDVGIIDSYAEIEYKGRTVTSNHCSCQDMKIDSAAELKSLATKVNGGKTYYEETITQIADIDLQGNSSNQWTTIGTEANPFKGTYEGKDYKISNIYINNNLQDQALFGYNEGLIKDLTVEGNVTSTNINIGGLTGRNTGEISKCINNVVVTGSYIVGGITGESINSGKISNCKNVNKIEGTLVNTSHGCVGGIAGRNNSSLAAIEECENSGEIIAKSNCVGGISGVNVGTINLCINNGIVTSTGASGTGGITGYQNINTAKTTNCQNKNEVKGVADAGGIVGNNYYGSINNCNNESNIIGVFDVGGISGSNANNSEINECKNIAKITYDSTSSSSSKGLNIGGIIGKNQSGAKVNNSQNEGEIVGLQNVGGLIGYSLSNSSINQCSNTAKVTGDNVIGGICGRNESSTIENSYNTANITSQSVTNDPNGNRVSDVGGIVGYSLSGYITDSHNEGQIEGNGLRIGGIAGNCNSLLTGKEKSIEKCYNTGKITGWQSGGIAGLLANGGRIAISYNKGEISSSNNMPNVGGIVGYFSNSYVENCYNTATITSPNRAGGIVGYIAEGGKISNCYNVGLVTGTNVTTQKGGIAAVLASSVDYQLASCYYLNTTCTGGLSGQDTFGEVESRTAAEMKNADFVNRINNGNSISQWKFDTNNINGGYPILSWQ